MRFRLLMLLGLGWASVAGCCGQRPGYVAARPLAPCDHCGTVAVLPPRFQPAQVPANQVTIAPAVALSAPTLPPSQDTYVPPVPGDPQTSRFAPENSRLPAPLPTNPPPPEPAAKLLPPQSVPQPVNDVPPMAKATEEPPLAVPALPADIPQYATAKKGVASGQQPFPDGIKWLKEHGYQAVLHVRAPTETDTAAKQIFENRGLRYLTLEVSPRTLTKETVDRFNQIVGDEKNQPLFVFDKNGSLAGAMWYLHFRTVEGMSDDKARAEATRLGFRQEQDDNHRDMWIAVQNYLKNLNP